MVPQSNCIGYMKDFFTIIYYVLDDQVDLEPVLFAHDTNKVVV